MEEITGWTVLLDCDTDTFWLILRSYAEGVGFPLTRLERRPPGDLYRADLSWRDPGTGRLLRVCRVHIEAGKPVVEVFALHFGLSPKGQQLARQFWQNFDEHLRELGYPARVTEVPATLTDTDEPARTEQEERDRGAVGEPAGQPGHPGLDHRELIYRLAKAQEAEEIRDNTGKYWKEIAKEIEWNSGSKEAGLALLRDARHRLRRIVNAEDEGLLQEIAEFRAKETKKTK